ncbi:metallophosphoesterase family protein [Brachybacterium sacelli]|uniref:Protein phosphatase n=1 Tax=Brachybacterium sacelli TaxID=173364 RepID=A0ABS4X0T5_9MICO|nr:metallophosphoesterase family protein [Brachybacterium sacelli]MBP2382078.1 protein phosphatase [Brachybacterium sacelli]
MERQRLAVVSDVHGNLTAYEAVLADIAERGITRVINLGDVVGKGPRGAACTALTRERCEAAVRGNWEVFVAGQGEPDGEGQAWWRSELSVEDRRWLIGVPGSLDLEFSGRRVRLLHASPIDEFTRVHREPDEETFAMMFEPTPFTGDAGRADVVVYGDIHDSYLAAQPGATLVNVGSVGNPLDEPTPSYAILEGVAGGEAAAPFGVQFVRVPYDIEAEIAVARQLGMPEAEAWAIELRTGIYRGRHEALGLR